MNTCRLNTNVPLKKSTSSPSPQSLCSVPASPISSPYCHFSSVFSRLFFSHLPLYSKQSFSPSLLFLQLVSSLLSSSCFLRVPGFPSPTLPLHPSNSILPLCITHQTLSSPQDLSLALSLSLSLSLPFTF